MGLRRALIVMSLCASALFGMQSSASASCHEVSTGDLETGCIENVACAVGSKLGWACVD